jgi:prolyl-tRNA editing enzyme YbaK/EbsC (Cys-tRNA(Pro) deacylase)
VRTSVDVHNFLVEREIPHEVISATGRFRTPERMAAVLELPSDEVGKVVVFEGQSGPVAAIVPAGSEPDPARLSKATGQANLLAASDDRAFELTEYLPEALPPVGLPPSFTTVVHRSLARDEVLYLPGGEARAVLKIRGKDLVKATNAKVAAITAKERPRTS